MKLDRTKPVYVYRNLNAGRSGHRVYSVMQNGRVVKRVRHIMLRDVTFVVREGGRQRVLRTGRKQVHAFAKGYVTGSACGTDRFGKLPASIYYNPRICGRFRTQSDADVLSARAVILNQHGMTGSYLHTVQYFDGPSGGW